MAISQAGKRAKGRDGQCVFRKLIESLGWAVVGLPSGVCGEDLLATDPDGQTWAIEVKKTKNILAEHRAQAMRQAKKRKARWFLASHIEGSPSWLVQRQGCDPVVWYQSSSDGRAPESNTAATIPSRLLPVASGR